MRGEWIEIARYGVFRPAPLSLPMRGEWIEIALAGKMPVVAAVSPHAGRVD